MARWRWKVYGYRGLKRDLMTDSKKTLLDCAFVMRRKGRFMGRNLLFGEGETDFREEKIRESSTICTISVARLLFY